MLQCYSTKMLNTPLALHGKLSQTIYQFTKSSPKAFMKLLLENSTRVYWRSVSFPTFFLYEVIKKVPSNKCGNKSFSRKKEQNSNQTFSNGDSYFPLYS